MIKPIQTKTKTVVKSENRLEQFQQNFAARNASSYDGPSAPRTSRKVDVDNFQLPSNYNETRLTLLARDPYYVHACWELSQQSVAEMRQRIGAAFDAAKYVLRMHDITKVDFNGQNANSSFDVHINPQNQNWYINLWRDNVAYCGELGVQTPDGQFHPFTQSNVISTPRASYSNRSDLVWMDVKDNKALPFIFNMSRRRRIEKALNAAHIPLRFKENGVKKIYLTEDDVRAYYTSLFPMLSKVRRKKKSLPAKDIARSRWLKGKSPKEIEDILFPGKNKKEFYKKFMSGASE